MPTAHRDEQAARRFLSKAIRHQGLPENVTIYKSGANAAAIGSYNKDNQTDIELRQIQYLNNIFEQDHRAIKRLTRPMLGFKAFRLAYTTLVGIELMHMIKKGQTMLDTRSTMTPAAQFYSLAG